MDDVRIVFPQRLRDAIEKSGINQRELSDRSDVPAWNISQYACGNRLPSLIHFANMVSALDVSAEYLLGLEKENED